MGLEIFAGARGVEVPELLIADESLFDLRVAATCTLELAVATVGESKSLGRFTIPSPASLRPSTPDGDGRNLRHTSEDNFFPNIARPKAYTSSLSSLNAR